MRYTILAIALLTGCPKAEKPADVQDTQEEQDGAAKSEGDSEQAKSDESEAGGDKSTEAGDESKSAEGAASSEDDE